MLQKPARRFCRLAVPRRVTLPSTLHTAKRAHQANAAENVDDFSSDTSAQMALKLKGTKLEGRSLYLDMQATTPVDPRVLDAMMFLQTERYGNPHSNTHFFGWEADAAVEAAREQVASLIRANPKEIIFTSGATESNNMAIKGIARFYGTKKKHIITTTTEHKCVLDSCRKLELEGFEVTYLPVEAGSGLVNLDTLRAAIRSDTCLVSVMSVNNEIGTVQDVKSIGALCREKGVKFHTDAAQSVGKLPIDVNDMNIDLMSISGHKIYGPMGIGALYVRRRPRIRLDPIISGGGQERGLRSGTLPAPLVVGLGKACEVAEECLADDLEHVTKLSKRLYDGLFNNLTHLELNGDHPTRYPGNLNVSFAAVEGESLLMGLKNVAVSSGSACTSASLEPSYVLRAIGVGDDLAHTSIRFGMGRFSTEEEVDFTIKETVRNVNRLRDLSPLWDMMQDGESLDDIDWDGASLRH